MNTRIAKFDIGQLVRHRTLPLRGVIVDVNAVDADEDEPVYHVLAEGNEAYGAVMSEHNLEPDDDIRPLDNPAAQHLFAGFSSGRYLLNRRVLN